MSCPCEPGATLRRLCQTRHPEWFRPENYDALYPRDKTRIRNEAKAARIAELEAEIRRLKSRIAQPAKGGQGCPK